VSASQIQKSARFLALHEGPGALLMPNPWDAGSAKLLASLGFEALATTSGGFAATMGRLDGSVTRAEALGHAAAIVEATELPVSADLENAFADDPSGVAETIGLALEAGLAGCSVEDYSVRGGAVYDVSLAADRVVAAAEAAHAGPVHLVLTARAENHIRGNPDLADTIARLQRYQEAGADVLFAPGVTALSDLRQVLAGIDRPLNVLVLPGSPPVAELAAAGVRRVSVGSGFALAAFGAAITAATELRDHGTYGWWDGAAPAMAAVRATFGKSG
jgi:2-methylisocitrate lyase-like PEP mutase family enzyme